MRDLRAELRAWDDNTPVEWEPAEGDILVGYLREPLIPEGNEVRGDAVVIDEEKTGIGVRVTLDPPVLAGLFELYNPRCHEKIGIRFTGFCPDGVKRFVMVIDRERSRERDAAAERSQETPDGNCQDEDHLSGATPEEREFIERMLSAESPDAAQGSIRPDESRIRGMIARQQEEFSRRSTTLGQFETMISPSVPCADDTDAQPPAAEPNPAPADTVGSAAPAVRGRRRGKWLSAISVIFIILSAGALIALAAFPRLLTDWWPR